MLFFEDLMEAGAAIKVKIVWVEGFTGIDNLGIGGPLLQEREVTKIFVILIVFGGAVLDVHVIAALNYFSRELAGLS